MTADQLEALKRKRDALNARIAKVSARANAERRKEDTRRKIIAGSILLEAVDADRRAEKSMGIAAWWDSKRREIKRPQDRALFEAVSSDERPQNSAEHLDPGEKT